MSLLGAHQLQISVGVVLDEKGRCAVEVKLSCVRGDVLSEKQRGQDISVVTLVVYARCPRIWGALHSI